MCADLSVYLSSSLSRHLMGPLKGSHPPVGWTGKKPEPRGSTLLMVSPSRSLPHLPHPVSWHHTHPPACPLSQPARPPGSRLLGGVTSSQILTHQEAYSHLLRALKRGPSGEGKEEQTEAPFCPLVLLEQTELPCLQVPSQVSPLNHAERSWRVQGSWRGSLILQGEPPSYLRLGWLPEHRDHP